jgi:hypothetical protein
MAATTLETVIEAIKEMTPDDQKQLRAWLDTQLTPESTRSGAEILDQKLLQAGIIRRIPPLIADLTPYKNRRLVEAKGKPLSEVILEERR